MSTTLRNEKLFCDKCGGEFALHLPIPITEMVEKTELFEQLHKNCKQTWTEPIVNQDKSTREKAMFWIANGEHGMSSKTMWNCFMDNKKYPINHPHDPDDFSRCYKLLETVPEWYKDLHKLKPLSIEWSNLVDNWITLTVMYKQNIEENWKNKDQIGMYQLMKELI